MTFSKNRRMTSLTRAASLVVGTFLLASCMTEVDDTTGSRLTQTTVPGEKPMEPVPAGDIAIAGQNFARAIRDLPVVAEATTPPLVQFAGVTSIVNGYVDTEPYTDLLRDRLLLGTREKLRFIERQLPPLVLSKKKIKSKSDVAAPVKVHFAGGATDDTGQAGDSDAQYQVLAELRGKLDDDLYRLQIQLVDFHSGEVLYNALYSIRKETPTEGTPETTNSQIVPPPPDAPAVDNSATGVR